MARFDCKMKRETPKELKNIKRWCTVARVTQLVFFLGERNLKQLYCKRETSLKTLNYPTICIASRVCIDMQQYLSIRGSKTPAVSNTSRYLSLSLNSLTEEKCTIVQSFYGKKSVNLPLIATEGFSTVLDSALYPY